MSNKRTVIDDKAIATILEDKVFQGWYENLRTQKEATAYAYKYGLVRYCQFTGKSPSQLIQEAYEDYRNSKMPWEQRYQMCYEQFVQKLRTNSEYTNNTKDNWIKSVRNFYLYHKILLTPIKTGIPRAPSEEYLDIPLLKIEDIRQAVLTTGTNKLLKAFILTLLSSGQAQAEVRKLKGKHIKNVQDGVAVVNFTRGKTNFRYTFFIGPEALAAIHDYKLDLKDDEFIFTQQNDRTKPFTAQEIDGIFKRHAEKLGFDRNYFAPHRFRHNYKTELTENMDRIFIEYTMGHRLPDMDSHYFKGEELEKMRLAYVKCLPLLTVFTPQEVLQKQYDELKKKHGTDRIESLEIELSDIKRKQLSEQTVKDIIDTYEEWKEERETHAYLKDLEDGKIDPKSPDYWTKFATMTARLERPKKTDDMLLKRLITHSPL